MKKTLALTFATLFPLAATAQQASSAYNVLTLPASSHASALGGKNISLVEDDPAAGWSNPALLSGVSDMTFGLNFMTYTASSSWMGANFVKAVGERHTVAAMAQCMNYGTMDETATDGTVVGSFSAKDIVVGGGYSYLLSDRWAGGANLKWLFSNMADYSAVAMTVDLGLNYYDEEQDLSISATLQNLGAQLKGYTDDHRSHPPVTLNLGLSKTMDHAPVRFHLMLEDLTRWSSTYFLQTDDEKKGESVSFGTRALNHVVVGIDILASERIYLSAGYNFRRAYELKAVDQGKMAGLSLGAGLRLNRLAVGLAYAKYHMSSAALQANVSYSL